MFATQNMGADWSKNRFCFPQESPPTPQPVLAARLLCLFLCSDTAQVSFVHHIFGIAHLATPHSPEGIRHDTAETTRVTNNWEVTKGLGRNTET